MLELTHEQHMAITQEGIEPILAVDPMTNNTYVLVRTEVYERIKGLLTDDEDWVRGAYPAAIAAFREGWDDPRMDVYSQ